MKVYRCIKCCYCKRGIFVLGEKCVGLTIMCNDTVEGPL